MTNLLNETLDVLIIGAGPIGLACGIEAANSGLNYVIIEKGCIVNSIFHYPTNMTFFSTSERIEIGGVPFVSHGIKPTRREALEYYRRIVSSLKLNVRVYEEVYRINKNDSGTFQIETSMSVYTSKNVIIASGFYDNDNKLNIPGEELPKVKHYFDEPHPYAYMNVAVIGAGNSAVDVALECYRTGANVTMLIREPELKPTIKYWVKPDIENRIKEGEIKAYFNCFVKEITNDTVIFEINGNESEIKNDFVFAMTGYHPNLEFIENFGVNINEGLPEFDSITHETNIPGLFLAGVICGGIYTDRYFIENSLDHPAKIINAIKENFS